MKNSALFFAIFWISLTEASQTCPEKVLICGVCRSIEKAVPNTILNAEALGQRFADYRVIIYENNSTDNTPKLLLKWAKNNPKVIVMTKNLKKNQMALSRTERIANARNAVLKKAREKHFDEYKFLVMVDLDFMTPWPLDEIIEVALSPVKWHCVSANGIAKDGRYCDLYAYRSNHFILNYELLGFGKSIDLVLDRQKWPKVYSAFGGLAIYKKDVITKFMYSGIVTEDLENYYRSIFTLLGNSHREVKTYLSRNRLPLESDLSTIPINFKHNSPREHPKRYQPVTCCEHLTLHASMALQGFNKFYIHPGMYMRYSQ